MIIAEDREATAVAIRCNLLKCFIIDGFGDNNHWRVGRADGEVLIDVAETPLICLEEMSAYRHWVRTHRLLFLQ